MRTEKGWRKRRVSLQDFIRACNRGRDIFFVPDEQQAIARLAAA